MIDRQDLLAALELRYVGQVRMDANEAAAMREMLADEILALDKLAELPVLDSGSFFPDVPKPTVTVHRYTQTDTHPVSECSPQRCGGDPRGWRDAIDPNKR